MFRFMAILLLLLFFVGVGAYGNNECIKEDGGVDPGLIFKNCTDVAEVAMKWKKEHKVRLLIITDSTEVRKFKLILNDQCELEFEGKRGKNEYAKWMKDNKTVANCESATLCDLQITNDGKLTTHIDGVEDQEVGCDNLHKEIDNTWVWTMFRVEDLPVDYKLDVYARDVDSKEEGMEYIPPSITDTPNFSATTIKLDYVIYVLVALSVVILLSTFVVFLSSIFAACKK